MADHLKERIRVTGHIADVRGIFHIKLTWTDENGKRCRKSLSTGLAIKGNRKRAEDMLQEAKKEHEETVNLLGTEALLDIENHPDEMLFVDLLEEWLEAIRPEIKLTTFGGYQMNVQKVIAPYFRQTPSPLSIPLPLPL